MVFLGVFFRQRCHVEPRVKHLADDCHLIADACKRRLRPTASRIRFSYCISTEITFIALVILVNATHAGISKLW